MIAALKLLEALGYVALVAGFALWVVKSTEARPGGLQQRRPGRASGRVAGDVPANPYPRPSDESAAQRSRRPR